MSFSCEKPHVTFLEQVYKFQAPFHTSITQRSLQNVLIFRLLLKITVERLRECVSSYFLSPYGAHKYYYAAMQFICASSKSWLCFSENDGWISFSLRNLHYTGNCFLFYYWHISLSGTLKKIVAFNTGTNILYQSSSFCYVCNDVFCLFMRRRNKYHTSNSRIFSILLINFLKTVSLPRGNSQPREV